MSRSDYLSVRSTDAIRGALACMVLVHHLGQRSGVPVLATLAQPLGYLAVGGFLFLSGYGLTVACARKGRAYLRRFPASKALSFWLCCALLVLLYSAFWLAVGNPPSAWEIVQSLMFGGTVVVNGWYLQVALA